MPIPTIPTAEQASDIFDAALYGCTYWCDRMTTEDERCHDIFSDEVTHCDIRVHDAEDDRWHTLTPVVWTNAITEYAITFGISLEDLYDNHDADIADNILQLALFGKVIYA